MAKDVDRHVPALDESEKREKFLTEWQERKGNEASYKSLICALLELECRQEAEFVCDLLVEDVSAASTTMALPPQPSGSANTGKI